MTDYSRQGMFDMQKISSAKITLVGGGMMGNYLSLYMSGLGIKHLKIIDPENGNEGEFLTSDPKRKRTDQLEEKLLVMNREMDIKTRTEPDDISLGKPDILVEFTNKKEYKEMCRKYATRNNIPLIDGASDEDNGSLVLKMPGDISEEKLDCYDDRKQGTFTSGIIAAIALDEIRKIIMPIKGEQRVKKRIDFSMHKQNRFNSGLEFRKAAGINNIQKMKALVAGAGGIGTYAALNLALQNIGEIDILDGDKIEGHNLNRQVFYYGKIGENKAQVLRERLKNFSKSKINAHPYYLRHESQIKEKYDIIFSCLDNWEWRFRLNNYAIKHKIPFVNGAVTTFSAKGDFSSCLECKYDKKELIQKEKNNKQGGCNNLNSNVVMQNAFIGALMASEAKARGRPQDYKAMERKEVLYNTNNADQRKIVVIDEVKNCLCNKERGCMCHEYRR